VQVQALSPEVAGRLGLADKGGVVLSRVLPGGPAAKAGLVDGDIVIDIAGQAVKEPRSLQRIVAGLPVGKSVELTVVRDGARKAVTLTIDQQPESFGLAADTAGPAATALDKVGASVLELSPKIARQFGYSEGTQGVLVAEVEPDSVADRAGLRVGTLIVKVDGHSVKTIEGTRRALEQSSLERGWLLQVRTPQGETTYVLLKSSPG